MMAEKGCGSILVMEGERLAGIFTERDLLTWVAAASVVHPTDELWEPVTAALVSARLNLDDLSTAAAEWSEHSVVTRLAPTDAVVESPGALSDASHRAEPGPTRATTRGPLPKVFHRRMKRRPKLS